MRSIQDLRIIFLGTPEFAVASLQAIIEAGARVVAVVTAPDKPAGRGMQLQSSAVKKYAESRGLPVLQPPRLKDPEFLDTLRTYRADLQVVVAFRMLPEAVWNMPPLGTINVHASLLPQYRGAAPINWAVINGEQETGVTTFRLVHEIDKGNILLQRRVPIAETDDAGTVHDKLMREGAALLVETVEGIAAGTLSETPQDTLPETVLRHAPKLFREHMKIDWEQPAEKIGQLVRGLSPYPAAYATLAGKQVKIYKVHKELTAAAGVPGSYQTDHRSYLRFAAQDGWIYIDELQQEGKKKMGVTEFLRGFRS